MPAILWAFKTFAYSAHLVLVFRSSSEQNQRGFWDITCLQFPLHNVLVLSPLGQINQSIYVFFPELNSIYPYGKKIILLVPSLFPLPLYDCASIYNVLLIYYISFHIINTLISSIKLINNNSSTTMAHILILTNKIVAGPHSLFLFPLLNVEFFFLILH